MKYVVLVQSGVIIEAETPEDAADQVGGALENARKRNCGDISDEILAGATVAKIEMEEPNDE